MSDQSVTSALDYYARNRAALFPIPAGQKTPTGIVQSFAHDCSTDPAQWRTWQSANPACNWGVVAGPSRWIIADVDVSESRDAAWAEWCEVCREWSLPAPAMPHVQSPSGGWHVYFQVPPEVDAATLRQPDARKKRINIRAGNGYVVAAGSSLAAVGPYLLLSDAPPYPAPAALLEHCTRRAAPATNPAALGTRDRGDVAALITWLAERAAFSAYEDWVGVGMALKLEFGDSGLDIWRLTHDATVTPDVEASKWESFSANHTAGAQTLQTWLQKANQLGWRGQVRKSAAALFDGVAAIAHAAGATLPGQAAPMPMMAGQQVLADLSTPILAEFMTATADAPARPAASDYPDIPPALEGHGLYAPLRDAVARVFALSELRGFKPTRIVDPLAILSLVHLETFDAVCRRMQAAGHAIPHKRIKLAATALSDRVERAFVTQDNWLYDSKGEIENDNSDNVAVFLGILSLEIRWNAWLERAEIRGGVPGGEIYCPDWQYIDDAVVAKLRTRGNRTKTRFRPGKDFFWESLIALAQTTWHDPAVTMLAQLAAEWDGTPRLVTWLSQSCGVECDPYHQAVSRNIIGGMVRRIREPGCKHDTMPVFYGYQGSGKSTLARVLAVDELYFTDEIMFGDASKELVLSLAGKSVVEIGEMGMRGSTNAAHVKAMITRQVDRGRTAYARTVSERPRRNVFIGTTNDDEPLTDPSGNRRFLPIKIDTEIDLVWLRDNIRQIVGEAAYRHAAGDDFAIPRSVWADAAKRQEAARATSDVELMLTEWLGPSDSVGPVSYILATDLAHLSERAGWRHGGSLGARGTAIKRLGFKQEVVAFGGKRVRIWARKPEGVRPIDVVRSGVRYIVSVDSSGRAGVTIRSGAAAHV